MPLQSLVLDTSGLPTDVLSYYDENFYGIVKKIAGPAEAKLLEAQGIRSVYSFLNTEDVFDILSIPCAVLKEIQKAVCLEAEDKSFIVKPGCRSNFLYLSQLLHQKHQENLKEISTKSKRNKQSGLQSQQNAVTHMDVSQGPTAGGSISSQQQDTGTSGPVDSTHYHDFTIRVLNEWIDKNSRDLNIRNEKLIENEDYRLSIDQHGSSNETCIIHCSCGIRIRLTKNVENFSLSNYYKHLKSKTCSMMRKKQQIHPDINDETSTMDEHDLSVIEVPENNSIIHRSESSTSTIIISKNDNTNKSLKRSSLSKKNESLSTKRIRK